MKNKIIKFVMTYSLIVMTLLATFTTIQTRDGSLILIQKETEIFSLSTQVTNLDIEIIKLIEENNSLIEEKEELNFLLEEEKKRFPVKEYVEELSLPSRATGSFKAYMDWRTITSKTSPQYALQQIAYTDKFGFRKVEADYMVALGTYYAKNIGDRFLITFEDKTVISAIVGDFKANEHTDPTNRFIEGDGNIVEFIIDDLKMNKQVLEKGDVSSLIGNGKIIKIVSIKIEREVVN